MNYPIYDIKKTYQENLAQGPTFTGEMPKRVLPPKEEWKDFLGFKVASGLGVPAGPLLDATWVALAAKLGFDVVTYKTIRSQKQAAHPLPNMVYLQENAPLEVTGPALSWSYDKGGKGLTFTNSFGMPSNDQDFLLQDIAKAKRALGEGQVLMVSVVGTPREGEDFTQDFVKAALIAKEGGADIVEANFSCPNVVSKEGSICLHPQAVFDLACALKKALKKVPLVIKVGAFEEDALLKEVLIAAARANVDGVCGINTLKRELLPPLSGNRTSAGVCGAAIHKAALSFTQSARAIIEQEKLGLALLATGGVVEPKGFDAFFAAGADVAMSAVGMMWDPLLASKYHKSKESCCGSCP